jgi:hypothetical protein
MSKPSAAKRDFLRVLHERMAEGSKGLRKSRSTLSSFWVPSRR